MVRESTVEILKTMYLVRGFIVNLEDNLSYATYLNLVDGQIHPVIATVFHDGGEIYSFTLLDMYDNVFINMKKFSVCTGF